MSDVAISQDAGGRFLVIGENIHTTRVVLRKGRHVASDGDDEWIAFRDAAGDDRRLPIPDRHRETDEYLAGRVKHVAVAIRTGMDDGADAAVALDYLKVLVQRQTDAGADYLDLNVDELSPMLEKQKTAMRWLVEQVQDWSDVTVSVDSSHPEIIEEGLRACRPGSRPMLNSASLERRDTVGLAVDAGGPIVVSAAGASGMPSSVEERLTNASQMVEATLAAGIDPDRIHIDPLIFPISVDGDFGSYALDAMRALRERFGPDIHITGGMSNVSFGIPGRKLINEAFLQLAIGAGADSGIVDPVALDIEHVRALDLDSGGYALARDAIMGVDVGCRAFLKAYRAGGFAEYGVLPPKRRAA